MAQPEDSRRVRVRSGDLTAVARGDSSPSSLSRSAVPHAAGTASHTPTPLSTARAHRDGPRGASATRLQVATGAAGPDPRPLQHHAAPRAKSRQSRRPASGPLTPRSAPTLRHGPRPRRPHDRLLPGRRHHRRGDGGVVRQPDARPQPHRPAHRLRGDARGGGRHGPHHAESRREPAGGPVPRRAHGRAHGAGRAGQHGVARRPQGVGVPAARAAAGGQAVRGGGRADDPLHAVQDGLLPQAAGRDPAGRRPRRARGRPRGGVGRARRPPPRPAGGPGGVQRVQPHHRRLQGTADSCRAVLPSPTHPRLPPPRSPRWCAASGPR